MRRETRIVDAERGTVQITMPDERWYQIVIGRDENKQPIYDYVPAVSWVSSHYPKGREFYRWLAGKGWDEAEEIKATAGDKGSKVHQAINALVKGGTVLISDCFENPRTNQPEELSPKEYFAVMTFYEWFEKTRPEVLAAEYTVVNERLRYAGTVDLLCRIGQSFWMIDFKTSRHIWPSMELQLSAYKHADTAIPKSTKLAILQVGYEANKKQKYKFTRIPDQIQLFMAARRIWVKETEGQKPFQRDYPMSLSLSPELTLKEVA